MHAAIGSCKQHGMECTVGTITIQNFSAWSHKLPVQKYKSAHPITRAPVQGAEGTWQRCGLECICGPISLADLAS